MRAFDLCAVCELPRFAHGWRVLRRRTGGMPFREPFDGSPVVFWRRRRWRFRLPLYRRGHRPAGISLACGYGRRSASTGTSRTGGTIDATARPAVDFSSFTALGVQRAEWATLRTPRVVNSSTVPVSFGSVTEARGGNGLPPRSAGSEPS